MDWNTAKKSLDFLLEHSIDNEIVNIGFYGGEPMIEFDLIKKCIEYAKEIFKGKDIQFSITTNGTLINKKIIRYFVKNKVNLTISLDGPKEVHDKNRRFCNGSGTFDKIISESIIKISTPIIFVLGVAQKTQKFEIQLALREKFINEGYKVSQIGSRRYSEFLGFHSFPDFMYNHSIGEINKIVLFNRLIAQIEMEEKPDVIIIGIPGGVMKLNNIMTNKFGVFSYEISQAVTPDVAIFSTFYEDYTPEYFMRINNSIKYKLGYEVDCFNLANVQFDWDNAHEVQRPVYLTLSSKFIDEKIESFKQGDVPLFNVLNESDTENMFRFIVDKLSDYSHIEII